MKKVFLILAGLAMVFIASCSSDPDEVLVERKTLQEMIDGTEENETLDLSTLASDVASDKSYTISKPITIANSGDKLKNSAFVIKSTSVSFESSTIGSVFVLAENATISADADTTIATVYHQTDTTFEGAGKIENKICINETEGDGTDSKAKILQEMIDGTEENETLDLSTLASDVATNKSYTISKPITIANSGDKLKDAAFVIQAASVSFKNSTIGSVFVLAENATISADADTTIATVYCKKSTIFQGEGKITNKIYLDGNESPEPTPAPDGNADPLQKKIDDTKSGETLDLENLSSTIATDKSYTILKPITIANCGKLQNATFVVHADSVSFSNATVGKVILAKENIKISAPKTTIEKLYCLYGKDKATIEDAAAYGEIIDTTVTSDNVPEDVEKAMLDSFAKFYTVQGFKVEGVKDGDEYCTKITNENAKLNSPEKDMTMIWDNEILWHNVLDVKQGKNYEISVELKAEKDSIVRIEALDLENYTSAAPSKYFDLKAGKWTTCTLQTGTAIGDWVQGKIGIQIGFVEILYAKQVKIRELDNKALGINRYYGDFNDYSKITCESADTKSLTLKIDDEIYNSGVEVFLPYNYKQDTVYKVSFDVTGTFNGFGVCIKVADTDYGFRYVDKDEKSVELYMTAKKDPNKQNQTYIPASIFLGQAGPVDINISNISVTEINITVQTENGTVEMESNGYTFWHRFENAKTSDPVVINSINFDGDVYYPKYDMKLLLGGLVNFVKENNAVGDKKVTLKIFNNFEGFYDVNFHVEEIKEGVLQASLSDVSLRDELGKPFKGLFIAGTMNNWTFELLDYTKDAESVIGESDPYGYGMWCYEFIEDYDCVESTPLMKPSSVEFKVCNTPGWTGDNEVFTDTKVDDNQFLPSEGYGNQKNNAIITCPISVGDKLCFCYDGKTYYAKVVKASAGENAGTSSSDD